MTNRGTSNLSCRARRCAHLTRPNNEVLNPELRSRVGRHLHHHERVENGRPRHNVELRYSVHGEQLDELSPVLARDGAVILHFVEEEPELEASYEEVEGLRLGLGQH